MSTGEYIVDSVLAAVKLRPAAAYGRYRLGVIPTGATIEIQGDSATVSGMVEASWNGQSYALFPADLTEKIHPAHC